MVLFIDNYANCVQVSWPWEKSLQVAAFHSAEESGVLLGLVWFGGFVFFLGGGVSGLNRY